MSDRYREVEGIYVPQRMVGLGYDVVLPWNYNKRRMAQWSTWVWPTDEDHMVGAWDLMRLRLECRNAYRNRPLARAISDAICRGAIGNKGIMPQPVTASDAWNDEAFDWWVQWSKVADYRQLAESMAEVDWLICHHMINDGEIFLGMMDNGQILPIEAELVGTPSDRTDDATCVNGAQLNANGIVVGWHVGRRNSGGGVDFSKTNFWTADQMIHVRLPARFAAIRGIPYFAPILAGLIDYDEYRQAVRLKVKYEAKMVAFHESEMPFDPSKLGGRGAPLNGGYIQKRESNGTIIEPGVAYETVGDLEIYHGAPGDKLTAMEQRNPGSQHVQFLDAEAKEICAACGVSVEWVRLAFDSSYIASRGAMLATSPALRRFQQAIITQAKQRLWNWRIAKAIKARELPPAPAENRNGFQISSWHRVFWHSENLPVLDRTKDSNADQRDYANRTATLTSLNRQNSGRDYRTQILPELISEIRETMRQSGDPEWKTRQIPLNLLMPFNQGQTIPGDQPAPAAAGKTP